MLVRPMVGGDGVPARAVQPGDIIAGGESLLAGAIATIGAGVWTGAAIATGIINRTGPVGAFTDTTDTAANIIAAVAGNQPAASVVPGTTFRFLFRNTVAQAHTYAGGTGVITGGGTLDTAASLTHEYLVTILNATPLIIQNTATTNGNKVLTFVFPAGQTVLPMGAITPGMMVSGAGITAGTLVLGVTMGVGGITGVVTDTNSTATAAAGVALTFSPTVKIDSLRTSTLG